MTKITLANLIDTYGANAFIFADAGNGSAWGKAGVAMDYDERAAELYGDVQLVKLDAPDTSDDGFEVNFASDWIDGGVGGDNAYRYRIMF